MNCVYKLCPTTLYSATQSRCSILSHDPLHHYLSSNDSLENSERELGYLFCYYRSCKNTLTVLLGECAHFATGISRVHYLNCGYVIQLIAFQWDTLRYAVHQTLPWLVRLVCVCVCALQSLLSSLSSFPLSPLPPLPPSRPSPFLPSLLSFPPPQAGTNMIISGTAIVWSTDPRRVITELCTSVEKCLQVHTSIRRCWTVE